MLIKRYLLPALVAVIVCYPIYGALLLAVDTFCGTGQLLQWAAFDSRHALLHQEIADGVASLSASVPIVVIATLIVLFSGRSGGAKLLAIALAAVAIIPALTFIAMGFTSVQAALFALVILLSAAAGALCSWMFNHAKH